MDNKKYIDKDVYQATIPLAVRDCAGKLVMESMIETIKGTDAAWLYELVLAKSRPLLTNENLYAQQFERLDNSFREYSESVG